MDLGYLTIYASRALSKDELTAGDSKLNAGRLGRIEIKGDQVLLGSPFIFNRQNIDRFDF